MSAPLKVYISNILAALTHLFNEYLVYLGIIFEMLFSTEFQVTLKFKFILKGIRFS